MRRLGTLRFIAPLLVLSLPASAQVINFSAYASPVTTEYQAAIGNPVTAGGIDFYDTELFVSGARNVLGTWGTGDAGAVNRPSNIGTSTAMFATQLGEEIDLFPRGTDVIDVFFNGGGFDTFNIYSMAVGHLYSTAYSSIALAPITLTVFGFGPGTGFNTIAQVFTIPVPALVGGVRTPQLQTLVFDDRWHDMLNVFWSQSSGSGTAHQFTDVRATLLPEPGTYALMFTGLAFVGVAARRRKPS